MSQQIIKQPDGLYCIYSDNINDFILENATKKDILKFRLEQEKRKIISDIETRTKAIERGVKPYGEFTLTYKQAQRYIKKGFGL